MAESPITNMQSFALEHRSGLSTNEAGRAEAILARLLAFLALLLLPWWCHWPSRVHATVGILALLLGRLQDLEAAQQRVIHTHHRACIVKLSTVIRCREECDQLSLSEKLVAVFHHLMCSADQVHVVLLQESRHHIWTEGERNTAVIFGPSGNVLVGIRPQQITEQSWYGRDERDESV